MWNGSRVNGSEKAFNELAVAPTVYYSCITIFIKFSLVWEKMSERERERVFSFNLSFSRPMYWRVATNFEATPDAQISLISMQVVGVNMCCVRLLFTPHCLCAWWRDEKRVWRVEVIPPPSVQHDEMQNSS